MLRGESVPEQVFEVMSISAELFRDQIVGMYLYGSCVLGGLRPNSDIDIFGYCFVREPLAVWKNKLEQMLDSNS